MWKLHEKLPSILERSGRDSSSDPQRNEEFDVRGPISLDVRTASGDITVTASPTSKVAVRLIARSAAGAERLEGAVVKFNEAASSLTVTTRAADGGHIRFRDFGRDDLDVEVSLPTGSSLEAHSASGDVVAHGEYRDVRFASASGDFVIESITGETKIDVASGDINIGQSHGSISVKTASGDINLGLAKGESKLHSVSGDVDVTIGAPLEARLHTVSGDLTVKVMSGYTVNVNASSLSGELRSEIQLDASGDATSSAPSGGTVNIDAKTISGDVQIKRA